MTRNKKLRSALIALQTPAIPARYQLSGTGARPDTRGYYQVVAIRPNGRRRLVGEGETPYQAVARALGHAVAARLELPRPSWAVLSMEVSPSA